MKVRYESLLPGRYAVRERWSGTSLGHVQRVKAKRWVAWSWSGVRLGEAPSRREATELVKALMPELSAPPEN